MEFKELYNRWSWLDNPENAVYNYDEVQQLYFDVLRFFKKQDSPMWRTIFELDTAAKQLGLIIGEDGHIDYNDEETYVRISEDNRNQEADRYMQWMDKFFDLYCLLNDRRSPYVF